MNRSASDLAIKEVTKHINSTLIQRTFNDCRRSYREKAGLEGREAVLISFLDQPPQLFSESEFIMILTKRKSDPFWQTVERITNFTWSKQAESRRHLFWYHRGQVHQELVRRAKQLLSSMMWSAEKRDPGYISPESELAFERGLPDSQRVIYSSYKLVGWMQRVHSIEVLQGLFEWTIDPLETVLLVDARGLSYKQHPKFEWNEEVY
jgi:hypothetical protein